MFQLKEAMELTTAHGLPRIVTNKPVYVRIIWLLLFLFMLCLFLKGFYDLVLKLQSGQVTSTLEGNSLDFQFPDVYACFENPISGSYSANIDNETASTINWYINQTRSVMYWKLSRLNYTARQIYYKELALSFLHTHSMPYTLLIDSLAHRSYQDIITSHITYKTDYAMPVFEVVDAEIFYHPMYLSCLKWTLNSTWQSRIVKTGSSSGLVINLNTDNNFTCIPSKGAQIHPAVYGGVGGAVIPLSDWSLSFSDFNGPERPAGVKIFLTPPGEYPTDYVSSFSIGPGKQHTVDIDMTQQVYKDGQFDCVSDTSDVQFVNPYDQTPYNHTYSYSHCYYLEHHRQVQELVNLSGTLGPLPWPMQGKKFVTNVTGGDPTVFVFMEDPILPIKGSLFDKNAKAACEKKRPCTNLDYSVSISSADWPSESSISLFVSTSIREAWTKAKAKNLSAPALDFLMTANASIAASYVRSNMLKVHFKPRRVLCDKLTFSIDYNLQSFVSDVGGIIGIYLGMSLLTFFELFELFHDLFAACFQKPKPSPSNQGQQKSEDGHSDLPKQIFVKPVSPA